MKLYIILLTVCSFACEPYSGTDREKHRAEREAEGKRGLFATKRDAREAALVKQAFAERFRGRIQPGVGCEVCSYMCKNADLRQMPRARFLASYRRAAREFGHSTDSWTHQVAYLELHRLGCIAKDGGPAMRPVWLGLLGPGESDAVRYAAAVQSLELGIASDEPRQVLQELAGGSGSFVDSAANRLHDLELDSEVSL